MIEQGMGINVQVLPPASLLPSLSVFGRLMMPFPLLRRLSSIDDGELSSSVPFRLTPPAAEVAWLRAAERKTKVCQSRTARRKKERLTSTEQTPCRWCVRVLAGRQLCASGRRCRSTSTTSASGSSSAASSAPSSSTSNR